MGTDLLVHHVYPRMFVFSRVTGHIRREGNCWTFLFLCDPFFGAEKARYKSDIAEITISNIRNWVGECVNEGSSQEHLRNLEQDGFGVVVKVLRDIKSTWKLTLNEFEDFLEEIVSIFCRTFYVERAATDFLQLERQF